MARRLNVSIPVDAPKRRALKATASDSSRHSMLEPLENRMLLAGNPPIPTGLYTLTNGASGLYLDDPQESGSSGQQLDQMTSLSISPDFGANQKFLFTYNSTSGLYTIKVYSSGLYLEDPGGSTTPDTALEQASSDGGTDQLWSVTATGSSLVIANDASGLVIDDPGSSSSANTPLDLYTVNGGNNQNWNFASAPTILSGVYPLENNASSLYLDDANGSKTAGAVIEQKSDDGTDTDSATEQGWIFLFNGAGYYTIQNFQSGLYLEDPGGSTTPDTPLEQGPADGGADQLWAVTIDTQRDYNTVITVSNEASGLVFDDPGSSKTSGIGMDLYTANGGSNQQWTTNLRPPIFDGLYTLKNGFSNLYLDNPGSSPSSGRQMVQNPSDGGTDEDWQFSYNGFGYYTIQNVASGLYLADPLGATTPGTALEQENGDGANDQLWLPLGAGSSMTFQNLATGLVMEDLNNSSATGAPMDLWTANGGSNQAWAITSVQPVAIGSNGQLAYVPDASGNTIENFSMVGYETGDVALPDTTGGVQVPVKETVNPGAAGVDMTATIQAAINAVEAMSVQSNGFRGAVLLTAGDYPIDGSLNITASGVVLEGQGNNATTGTRLEDDGTTQRFLVNVNGSGSYSTVSNTTHNITDSYVPVGATSFDINSTSNLSVGQTVIVSNSTNQAWIDAIGMNELNNPWGAGTGDQTYYRIITAINGDNITINAPITNAIDPQYGAGTISAYTWSKLINNDGMENIYSFSDSTSDSDQNHATGVLSANDAANFYMNNVTANGFESNQISIATVLYSTLDNLTVENTTLATDPPSGILFTGQLDLIENSTFISAYHGVAINGGDGPNVIYNVSASGANTSDFGPHQRWTTGMLFDNVTVTGGQLHTINRGNDGSGQGWSGANDVFWNDPNNQEIDAYNPATAQNWVIGGSAGQINNEDGTSVNDYGNFVDFNSTVQPQSLYQEQLLDRLTPTVVTAAAATPGTVTGTTTTLTTLGGDAAGESTLTYTWSVTAVPNGATAPTFNSNNGTNAGKSTVATFSKPGAYTFLVTIQYPGGFSVTSSVNVTVNQTATTVTVSPTNVPMPLNGTQQFTASILDQFGNAMSAAITWSATGGSISSGGFYTAPSTADIYTVKATVGSASGTTTVTVGNQPPTVQTAAAATPNPVTGTSTTLSVLGADDNGESNLTYTWAITGTPPAAVIFSINGNNAAQNTTATFTAAGTYHFQVTITDPQNLSTTSSVQVIVKDVITTITITPAASSLAAGQTEQFAATAFDQFGNVAPASFQWKAPGGSISNSGIFTAPSTSGSYTVTATSGAASGSGYVQIGGSPPVITTAASASPGTISSGGSTTLSVVATDNDGAANLTYTWTTVAEPNGATAPVFGSVNGANAGQNTPVTLTTAGNYIFHVTIEDPGGLVVSANASVSVNAITDSEAILASRATYSSSNLALQTIATATSTAAGSSAENLVDGNTVTSWTSASAGYQILNLDLGGESLLTHMTLDWGSHYASIYAVQVSTNGKTWKTAYETNKGVGGTINISGFYSTARYARIVLYKTPFTNYTVNELYIYGK